MTPNVKEQGEECSYFKFLFIDFNAFFAAVEQHDEPILRGRPVIVIPLASRHTSAIAVSYEARRFGIKRGTKVWEAEEKCPGIAIRPARHDRYVAVHRLLMSELQRHLPLEKIYSIDEAAFRLGQAERTHAGALSMAEQIKAGLASAVGPALRSSIGISASPLLAKLAAESNKPDGMTILPVSDLPHRFSGMELTDIPGVGAGVRARLAQAGVHTFEKLWHLAPKQARAIWGSVAGERFWYQLHGYETKDPPVTKSMIGHSRVLTRGYETPKAARLVARALLLKAASRLRHYNLYATRLSLSVRQRPEGRQEDHVSFSASQDSYLFLTKLDEVWERLVGPHSAAQSLLRPHLQQGLRLGGVTVYLHGLCAAQDTVRLQGDLFADEQKSHQDRKREQLWKAIDLINSDPEGRLAKLGHGQGQGQGQGQRQGQEKGQRQQQDGHAAGSLEEQALEEQALSDATDRIASPKRLVTIAGQQSLDLNYLGTKIAFSRVPDEVEFLY